MQDAVAAQDTTGVAAQISSATESVVDKVVGWITAAVTMLPNLIVAILVLLAFVLIAKGLRRLVERVMRRVSGDTQVTGLLSTVVYIGVVAIGLFVALGVLQLDKAVTSLLAGVGIIGLALGFAFQDIAANFVSGVLLAFRRPFHVGDLIESNDLFGQVKQMNLRATLLRQLSGQIVYVPNKDIFTNPIVNFSALGERRVEVDIGVSYNDDLEQARQVALQAVDALPLRKQDRPVEVYYKEFGDSSINFVLHFWIDFTNKQSDFLEAQSQAIMRIKAAFDREGITIPFPIRTLDLGNDIHPFQQVFSPRAAGNGDRESPS